MNAQPSKVKEFKEALNAYSPGYEVELDPGVIERLSNYYVLLGKWNPRLHLVASTSPQEFAKRHVLESLFMLRYLPRETRVADIGSGAGLPIIPCLIVRPDIDATLIESSKKKAIFLREALNRAEVSKLTTVIADRFEDTPTPKVDFVTCRALDRFERKLPSLVDWSPSGSTMLLFGGKGIRDQIVDLNLSFAEILIPNSERRFLFVIKRHGDG